MPEGKLGDIPLIIGVTGHRDLRHGDEGRLRQIVATILAELRDNYPTTPIVVLSQLAEGADRLVVSAALENGAEFIATLPLPRDDYKNDFATTESKQEFDRLLTQAKQVLVLCPAAETADPSIATRDLHYQNSGAYISRHCHILLALWDGVDSQLPGGTWEIVKFKLVGIPEIYLENLLDPAETGPVYHIVTPRMSNPNPAEAFSVRRLYPKHFKDQIEAEKAYARIFQHTDRFNTDMIRLAPRLNRTIQRAENEMIGERTQSLQPDCRYILKCYAQADGLAILFQKQTLRIVVALFVLSFAAAFFYEIYPHAVHGGPLQLDLYFASLCLAYLVYFLGRQTDCENKYLDYRALAEGLRVQFFWQIGGVSQSAADHYLHKQRSELDWIRNAIRACTVVCGNDTASLAPVQERMQLILKYWLDYQRSYYSGATNRDQRRLNRFKSLTKALLFSAGVMALIKLLFLRHEQPPNWFLVVMGLAPAVGAFLHGYTQKRGLSEHAKQYARVGSLFVIAQQRLQDLVAKDRTAQAELLLEEVGKEALAENGDWVILHRERKIEMPKLK